VQGPFRCPVNLTALGLHQTGLRHIPGRLQCGLQAYAVGRGVDHEEKMTIKDSSMPSMNEKTGMRKNRGFR
jgi:hypothetical protein